MRASGRGSLCALLLLAASACRPLTAGAARPATATLALWPSATQPAPTATALATVAATAEAGPSPTPFKHVVQQYETLLGIAALYGVTLDALLAVNPGVDPLALSIGQELLIPGPEGDPIEALIPTSTPIPLGLLPPRCFRRATGGMACVAGVVNPTTQDLENLVIEIRLHDSAGEVVDTQQAFPPLNRLPAGGRLPVAAAFPEAGDVDHATARVLSVILANESEARYATPRVERSGDERQEGGTSWRIEGTIRQPAEAAPASRTLLLVTAYDDGGQVAGFAVWEAMPPMEPGETRAFDVRVFSLGPPIARFELLAESYALEPPG